MSDATPEPGAEILDVATADQYRAFGHPLRQRLLYALGQQRATISQLAVTLGAQKGSIAHHLKVLRQAGFVRLAHTRQVRGGTEQYYERTAQKLVFHGPQVTSQTASSLHLAADELARSPSEPFFVQRRLRLTAAQVAELASALPAVADNLADAGADEARYHLVLGYFEVADDG